MEICIEFPKELKDTVPTILTKSMEKAASAMCKSLPIPAVAETSTHWIH